MATPQIDDGPDLLQQWGWGCLADSSFTGVILVENRVNPCAMAAVVKQLVVACVLEGRAMLVLMC